MTNWAGRGNRHERGYGNAWDKLRLQILRRDCYLCRCSECQPIGAPFPTRNPAGDGSRDHRIPKARGGSDDPSNLAAIGEHKPKRETGTDGWLLRG